MQKGFSISEMLKFGWHAMKNNLPFFIGIILTMFVINNLTYFFAKAVGIPENSVGNIFIAIAGAILGLWMALGAVNIALMFAKNEKAKFSDLFSRYDLIGNYLGASLLYAIMLIGGFILFIIPMFIWGSKYGLYPYFIIEKGAGPLESLKLSAETTMGAKWDVVALWIITAILNILGALSLGVGLFATLPLTWVAFAYAYRTLVSQTEH